MEFSHNLIFFIYQFPLDQTLTHATIFIYQFPVDQILTRVFTYQFHVNQFPITYIKFQPPTCVNNKSCGQLPLFKILTPTAIFIYQFPVYQILIYVFLLIINPLQLH